MSVVINFSTVALQYKKPLIPELECGVTVWDGERWVPLEEGTREERRLIRRLVMASPLAPTMPAGMRAAVMGE